jgi:tRNA (guanine37-N1)-methyltransferase
MNVSKISKCYLLVNKINAEHAKKLLTKNNYMDVTRKSLHIDNMVGFPIINVKNNNIKKLFGKAKINFKIKEKKKYSIINKKLSFKDAFIKEPDINKSYDLLGNIAVIGIKNFIINNKKTKEKVLKAANVLMKFHPNIKTVVAKVSAISGKYRTRKFKYITGKKTYIAEYKENNCIFKFDIRKSFFSNRLSYERSRIIKNVNDNDNVMVMFAGVGPFSIEIAKAHPSSKVVSIELNKYAFNDMIKNIKINKVKNVIPVFGDVKKVSKNYKDFANKIIMPLPKDSINFLDDAFIVAKNNAIITLYTFGPKETVLDNTKKIIEHHAKRNNYVVEFIFDRIVKPYSRFENEIVIDYKIIKNE